MQCAVDDKLRDCWEITENFFELFRQGKKSVHSAYRFQRKPICRYFLQYSGHCDIPPPEFSKSTSARYRETAAVVYTDTYSIRSDKTLKISQNFPKSLKTHWHATGKQPQLFTPILTVSGLTKTLKISQNFPKSLKNTLARNR